MINFIWINMLENLDKRQNKLVEIGQFKVGHSSSVTYYYRFLTNPTKRPNFLGGRTVGLDEWDARYTVKTVYFSWILNLQEKYIISTSYWPFHLKRPAVLKLQKLDLSENDNEKKKKLRKRSIYYAFENSCPRALLRKF